MGILDKIKEKRENFYKGIQSIDFSITKVDNWDNFNLNLSNIRTELEKFRNFATSQVKFFKFKSDFYLKGLILKIGNLIDKTTRVKHIDDLNDPNLKQAFKDLGKEFEKISKTRFIMVGEILDYKPAKEKFKIFSNDLCSAEKNFDEVFKNEINNKVKKILEKAEQMVKKESFDKGISRVIYFQISTNLRHLSLWRKATIKKNKLKN